jgi:hypothetical protein
MFDIKVMGNELFFPEEQHRSFRETVALRLVETAVDIINEPNLTEQLLLPMIDIYELEMGMNRVDDRVMGIVERIRQDMRNAGWDPRMKIRLEERKLSNTYHRAIVCMDLDATVKAVVQTTQQKKTRKVRETKIADVVSDNPGVELINELDRVVSRQSQRRTPLLSDRNAQFVRDDKDGNRWR